MFQYLGIIGHKSDGPDYIARLVGERYTSVRSPCESPRALAFRGDLPVPGPSRHDRASSRYREAGTLPRSLDGSTDPEAHHYQPWQAPLSAIVRKTLRPSFRP